MGNDVGDRLRLTRARRSIENEVMSFFGGNDCRQLRAVRRQGCKEPGWIDQCVEVLGSREILVMLGGRTLALDKVANDAGLLELVGAVGEVLPHQVLRKREGAEHYLLSDLEPWDIA